VVDARDAIERALRVAADGEDDLVGHSHEGTRRMEPSRKPLAKVEGRKRMRQSGVTVAWRGTPSLDDWVAYIVNGTKSRKLILADHTSERKVKALLARINGLSKKEVEKLAKG
jgi:hypothetical protein